MRVVVAMHHLAQATDRRAVGKVLHGEATADLYCRDSLEEVLEAEHNARAEACGTVEDQEAEHIVHLPW
jgi:hypothetical protein